MDLISNIKNHYPTVRLLIQSPMNNSIYINSIRETKIITEYLLIRGKIPALAHKSTDSFLTKIKTPQNKWLCQDDVLALSK